MSEQPSSQQKHERASAAQRLLLHQARRLLWRLSYIIAIPVFVLGFGGAYLDKYLGTSPLFLLAGFAAAACTSLFGVLWVMRRLQGGVREPPGSVPKL